MNAIEVRDVMVDMFGPAAQQVGLDIAQNVRSVIAVEAMVREIPLPLVKDELQALLAPESVLGAVGEIVGTEDKLREALADSAYVEGQGTGGPFMALIANVIRWARKAGAEVAESATFDGPSTAIH